jgi:predicted RNase H-like HicB family nuclease
VRQTSRQHERLYNFWVLVRPAEDVPGQWLAHCLETDVVTQGNSIEHVLEMIAEAAQMVVAEDIASGRDPYERRAPQEYWDELYELLRNAEYTDLSRITQRDPASISLLAAQIVVRAQVQKEEPSRAFPALWSNRRTSQPPAAQP